VATAIHGGTGANSIVTQDTSAVLSWSAITLLGGLDAEAGTELEIEDMAPIGGGDNEVLVTTLGEPRDVANKIDVSFFDVGKDYEYSHQIFTGDTETSTQEAAATEAVVTPMVMTDSEAYRRASRIGFKAGDSAITQELRLPWKYLAFEPADVIRVSLPPYTYLVKMDEVTLNGDFSLSIGGTNFSTQDNIVVNDLPDPPASQIGIGTGESVAVVIDGPIFNAASGGLASQFTLYTGVRSYGQANFSIAALIYRDVTEADPVSLYRTRSPIPMGTAMTVLPDTDAPWCTDTETEFTVASLSITSGMMESLSYEDYLLGYNALVVGAPGRWEYVWFRDVAMSGSEITFTNLARGRRGTEVNVGTHEIGDQVYLVAATGEDFVPPLSEQNVANADEGEVYEYQAFGVPSLVRPVFVEYTLAGYSQYPWAPTGVTATLGGSDEVDLAWLRRDRFATNDWLTEDIPLSEASEEYELDIMDGSTVVRTVTGLTTPDYSYSAADQATDGFTPPLTSIKVRVFQVGVLGRGFMKEITVDVV
jgi:hypothetical protein